jgi:hypothetical protein
MNCATGDGGESLTVHQLLRNLAPDYQKRFGPSLPQRHRQVLKKILLCRTPALGGQLFACPDCPGFLYRYHSCNDRHCPQCGQTDADDWLQRQRGRLLLPTPYFLVTFTVPEGLRQIIRSQQKGLYAALFAQSAGALTEVALTKLGIELGLLGVLHTWSRQLIFHPHVHYVVPGGGLTPDGLRWLRVKDADFFLKEEVLALRFKNRLRQYLEAQHQDWLKAIPAKVWQQSWVVDVQPVGSGEAAVKYLSAYVYRTALGSQRIVRDEEGHITFTYRESESGESKLARVSAEEFLRRFLQHVLPRGFQRVRYFGWWSAAATQRWTRIQTLLDWKPAELKPAPPRPAPECPVCRRPMRLIGRIARGPPVRGP